MGEINDRERALAQLLWAVRNDDVSALVKVIGEHNDYTLVNAADYDKRTPLHVAASNNSLKAASMLLSVGACVDALDRWNNTPMANAQSSGFQDMVKLLTYNGARPVAAGDASESGSKPPSPHKMDWMIDPREIDLSDSSLIGKGSFGEIRQATWRGTKVAVKSIRNSLSKVINDVRQPLFWIFQKQKFVILCGSTQICNKRVNLQINGTFCRELVPDDSLIDCCPSKINEFFSLMMVHARRSWCLNLSEQLVLRGSSTHFSTPWHVKMSLIDPQRPDIECSPFKPSLPLQACSKKF
jgi:hypothetical protein